MSRCHREKTQIHLVFCSLNRTFVPMNNNSTMPTVDCDNVIVVDADFVDKVAFDLIVNFERMLGRRIPNADLARWIDCLALDGGVREGQQQTQVALVHGKAKKGMDYFTPNGFENELNGKAFSDNLGEFVINTFSEQDIVGRGQLLVDMVALCAAAKEVKRLIIVPDEADYDAVRHALRQVGDDKRVTVLAMQPMPGGNFRQEILGYSLMSALGIRADEL